VAEPKTSAQKRRTSLFADLRSGDAGPGVRVFVSLALGSLLCGLAAGIPCYLAVISAAFGRPGMSGNRFVVSVKEEVLLVSFLLAAVVYLVALYWLWSKPLHHRGFWLAGALTVGIWLVTIPLCIGCEVFLARDEELVIFAVVCMGIAATLFAWVQVWRRYGQGRPVLDAAGQFDVRCPACNYSMIGLYDTRCPECGEKLTLDQLLQRQGFDGAPGDQNRRLS